MTKKDTVQSPFYIPRAWFLEVPPMTRRLRYLIVSVLTSLMMWAGVFIAALLMWRLIRDYL
jgi:hypothetical protein